MRILGIDTGARRTGFAVSDPLGITAQALETFDAAGGAGLVDHIGRLIEAYGVDEIVIGYPLGLSGQRGESTRRADSLAAKLRERYGVEVTLWDERFSSVEAKRALKGSRGPKSNVDKIAAVIILQSYLDSRGKDR